MDIQPFTIDIPQATLDDLGERLSQTRWPDAIEDAGWDYGTDLTYLKELAGYWQSGFDWRTQEASLNRFTHFRAEIDGFGLHFLHEKGKGDNPLPLLLTHGYPDSFYRFHKLLPLLTDPVAHGGDPDDAFDVVIPSLPGFGFSDRPRNRGMGVPQIAGLFARLMSGLGYESFGAHGGDWGSSITEALAFQIPERLRGIHLTDIPYWHLFVIPSGSLSDAEKQYLEAGKQWQQAEGAYALIQGTKPQSLAYAMNDSPSGLAAWLVEKFRAWSDCAGNVESRFTRDELLTHIMLYWVTGTAGSAFRLYYENMHVPPKPPSGTEGKVTLPTGVAIPPKDLVLAPREFGERFFAIQRWAELQRGGHFAAWEEPELLASEIRAFFRPMRRR